MGNSGIKPHLQTAEKTGACNLSKQGLNEFPGELLRIAKNLRNLDLSENKLPAVPPALGSFSLLKNLNLNNNRLCSIPEEIGQLKKLECLSVCHNNLRNLPQTMAHLKCLREIKLSYNHITHFPIQLGDLKSLDSIDLSHNQLTEVPEGIRSIQAIEINLNQNQISRLSDSVAECPRLKVLRLDENCLEIPSLTPTIMKESSVSLLSVEGNLFEMKKFRDVDGYDQYMERYTATKKKFA